MVQIIARDSCVQAQAWARSFQIDSLEEHALSGHMSNAHMWKVGNILRIPTPYPQIGSTMAARGTWMPKSMAISNPTCWGFRITAMWIITISAGISKVVFNTFTGDSGSRLHCRSAISNRDFLAAQNLWDCNFAISASKSRTHSRDLLLSPCTLIVCVSAPGKKRVSMVDRCFTGHHWTDNYYIASCYFSKLITSDVMYLFISVRLWSLVAVPGAWNRNDITSSVGNKCLKIDCNILHPKLLST